MSTLAFATGTNSSKPASPPTTAAAITQLENKGVIPKLDRSAGLKGPVTNNNGIRDDIDAFLIIQKWAVPKLKAAQQHARVLQDQVT